MKNIIIAIDGPSGGGKSTTAKLVAQKLNYAYIDTGAMYRAVTLYFLENNIDFNKVDKVIEALQNIKIHFENNLDKKQCETFLNSKNVESEIRKMYVSEKVSEVSSISEVRKAMVNQQQILGKKGGVVMDGRDIGTQVFPNAELKIFMVADLEIRAKRRKKEFEDKGQNVKLERIKENLKKRDYIDSTRAESPLSKAGDAIELDTSNITIGEQADFIINLVEKISVPKEFIN